ncbi:hypothetical protein MAR_016008 [Mya arenaria]|uniref:Uncharacterized protein n=1 Tax=Mya arenaria TaxID=6604 RepID=A0ABY7FLW1_MYAAR|nr:hypothetical protein MAR_015930 [Mya arenaria]WAR21962.1 hypothetical protein MAR_015936 [Mya arenaria]WAR22003.1 hypothetical protein MAR_015977 [Mya arenaria]WAR22019.1 hypothetical protein MAR_015993 [Mya arenaria]WAR22032.1 hypothetical protein MAR_016006 [Mya arenaria]
MEKRGRRRRRPEVAHMWREASVGRLRWCLILHGSFVGLYGSTQPTAR